NPVTAPGITPGITPEIAPAMAPLSREKSEWPRRDALPERRSGIEPAKAPVDAESGESYREPVEEVERRPRPAAAPRKALPDVNPPAQIARVGQIARNSGATDFEHPAAPRDAPAYPQLPWNIERQPLRHAADRATTAWDLQPKSERPNPRQLPRPRRIARLPHQEQPGTPTRATSAGAPMQSPAPAPPAPTIQVTIGRIEVRAVNPTQPARTPAPKQSPTNLEEYLKLRSNGGSA
ncbi:MAG: hypothetical protein M3Z23_08635, partial [Acidobacteriota bacterium]|nr:hypothetical protein [Acidobacteriota bacterium]